VGYPPVGSVLGAGYKIICLWELERILVILIGRELKGQII